VQKVTSLLACFIAAVTAAMSLRPERGLKATSRAPLPMGLVWSM